MNDYCALNDCDLDNVSGGDPMASSNCGIPGYNYCWYGTDGGLYAGQCPKTLGAAIMDEITRFKSPAHAK
jgi:hypothetical protein